MAPSNLSEDLNLVWAIYPENTDTTEWWVEIGAPGGECEGSLILVKASDRADAVVMARKMATAILQQDPVNIARYREMTDRRAPDAVKDFPF